MVLRFLLEKKNFGITRVSRKYYGVCDFETKLERYIMNEHMTGTDQQYHIQR